MQKVWITFVAFLCLVPASIAQSQGIPAEASLRYSEQVSNGPTSTCGCFGMEGGAADLYLNLTHFATGQPASMGLVVDAGVEHTSSVGGAGYGLTLTTIAAGPRFVLLPAGQLHPFLQALFGFAHGSGSQFPQNNSLVPTANSFAVALGGGADYTINRRFSWRILQVEYLRTALPNNTSNWQNNLRIGTGITLQLSRPKQAHK